MATTARAPLSRDRILRAALELVDEGGIESLSMRKLGQRLGFEAMSLYNHVANKDDLIDGILDLVLAEGELPSPTGDWDKAVRASAISVHAALQRHPWACTLVMAPGHIRPARMEYMNALLGRLRTAEFSADETYHAYHVLDGHIFGYSLYETSHSYTEEDAAEFEASLDQILPVDKYPYLNEHGKQHLSDGPHRGVSAFELGLDLILDGLRKTHPGS
jgi:AcrR family transcriptional regulator